MLAEIFMLRLETGARVAEQSSRTTSSRFVALPETTASSSISSAKAPIDIRC
jgi:hypothetical protein